MSQFDTVAPFFKHSFWREEEEVRALLSVNEVNSNNSIIGRYEDGSRYFDLDITADCIKGVILGPECSEKDVEELEKISGKISFGDLITVKSEGTGVLINR